ncbi:MAG TPA: 50S ribosomal protein L4 [Clostridia bacterium]|nr:50S ribosomal protein L4 [Clostridia bacterium]
MPKVAVYNMDGNQVDEINLSDDIFGIEVNEAVLHQAVTMQLANERQGTASTKTISMVRGGGAKPWRQKGTGRARHGSIRSPLWRGGAVVFGPHPRSYAKKMPKKMRRLALKSALSAKTSSEEILVLDQLQITEPKTKTVVKLLNNLKAPKKVLIVLADFDENVYKSARNIAGVKTIEATGLNVYDILNADKLIFTKDAVARVEEVLG